MHDLDRTKTPQKHGSKRSNMEHKQDKGVLGSGGAWYKMKGGRLFNCATVIWRLAAKASIIKLGL
jgi:hypothetical protein